MKTLLSALILFLPIAAHADSGWQGECRSAGGRLTAQVLPWDDDGKVIVRADGRKIYDGVDLVSTFDDKAAVVSFEDTHKEKMTLTIDRKNGTGTLRIGGREIALRCDVNIVETND
jgi:hypothetical protein